MDILDRAQQLEDLQRSQALKTHFENRRPSIAQLIIDNEICCRDCHEPIEPERLKANPHASKCISCQLLTEKL